MPQMSPAAAIRRVERRQALRVDRKTRAAPRKRGSYGSAFRRSAPLAMREGEGIQGEPGALQTIGRRSVG
jgi:hypothetical protein